MLPPIDSQWGRGVQPQHGQPFIASRSPVMRGNSIVIVRLMFTALIIFAAAAIVSTRIAGSSVPMVLAVILFTVYLLRELSVVYHGPDSPIKSALMKALHQARSFKYSGVVLGGVVIAVFLVVSVIASVVSKLI
jgi:hypothetical protein